MSNKQKHIELFGTSKLCYVVIWRRDFEEPYQVALSGLEWACFDYAKRYNMGIDFREEQAVVVYATDVEDAAKVAKTKIGDINICEN